MRILTILMLIIQAFTPAHTFAGETQEIKKSLVKEKKKLKDVLHKIEEGKKDLEEASLKEKELLVELGEIEEILEKRENAVIEVEYSISKLNKKMVEEAKRADFLIKEKARKEERLKKRMIALYKIGSVGPVKALFSSDSYISLLKRFNFMQLIMQNDLDIIKGYRLNTEELNSKLQGLNRDRKEAENLKKKLKSTREAAEGDLNRKKRLLTSVSKSKALYEKALKEMETSSTKLGLMISRLENSLYIEKDVGGGHRFSDLKGRLDFPSEGEILSFYGKTKDPRFNTTIFQKGIEIAAPIGSDIRAIHDGKILYADWFRGYGKIIIIDHGEGYYSLSAHASKLLKKVGSTAQKGETVAKAGDTGSLKGPFLYFEIRHKGKPVDPLDWLNIPLNNLKDINQKATSRRKK